MSLLAQQLIVSLIFVLAAVSATWRLLSATSRVRLLAWLLRGISPHGALGGRLHRGLERRRAALQAGGCGNCSANAAVPKRRI
jgi:hypothetical protein